MMKIYTPEAWLSVFGGSPSLIIDDNGYIYSADGYYKIISECPIGKIDFEKGYIYDKHYLDLLATPIAYMINSNGVIKVREYGKSQFSDPILYIQNDKIYTPEEYLRIFGGEASGYVNNDSHTKDNSTTYTSGISHSQNSYKSDSSGGGGGLPVQIAGVLGFLIIVGIIYLLSNEARLASTTVVLAIIVNICAVIYFLLQIAQGKLHFHFKGEQFAKSFLTGVGVFLATSIVFTILGLFSNIGTGNALSDAGGNKMELSALFISIPFVVRGLFAEGKGSTNTKTNTKTNTNTTTNANTKTYTNSYKKQTVNPFQTNKFGQKTTAKTKEVFCPHCGNRCSTPVKKLPRRVACPYCKKTFTV